MQYIRQKYNKFLQEKKKKPIKKVVKLKKFDITSNIKCILNIILLQIN
jgi:hypothetical protein